MFDDDFADAQVDYDDLDEYDQVEADTATGSLDEVAPTRAQMPTPIDFQALSASEWQAVITELRVWVAWFVEEMRIEAKTIPPCWEQHSDIVVILSALERHYKGAYHPMSSPFDASSLHMYAVPTLLARIETAHRCGFGKHELGKVQSWAAQINESGHESDAWIHAEADLGERYERRMKAETAKASLSVVSRWEQ